MQLKDSHAKALSISSAAAESELAAAVAEKDIAEATVISCPSYETKIIMPTVSNVVVFVFGACPSYNSGAES